MQKEVEIGSWGTTMREDDYGLDLLGVILGQQLKKANFTIFSVTDELEVIKADIMEESRRANRGCSASDLFFYFSKNFKQGRF